MGIGAKGCSAVAGSVALLVLTGCGAVVEAALEQAAEEATGLEVDQEDGTITFEAGSVEGNDVSVVVDTNGDGTGSVNFASPEGSAQLQVEAEVPDGFPVPYPGGARVQSGTSFRSGEGELLHLELLYPESAMDDLVAYYDDYFASVDGADGVSRHEVTTEGERMVGFITNPDGRLTAVTVVNRPVETVVLIEAAVGAE